MSDDVVNIGAKAQHEADLFTGARDAFRAIQAERGTEFASFMYGMISGEAELMPNGFATLKQFFDETEGNPALRLIFAGHVKYDLANPAKKPRKPRTKKTTAPGYPIEAAAPAPARGKGGKK